MVHVARQTLTRRFAPPSPASGRGDEGPNLQSGSPLPPAGEGASRNEAGEGQP